MKGILDRIEDGDQAVILVEEIQKALIIPLKDLPAGSKVNTFFHIKESNGDYQVTSIDDEATRREAQKSEDLMAKLRAKSSRSNYSRNE